MRASEIRRLGVAALAAAAAVSGAAVARAQEIEPRTLSPAPVGVNFLVASFANARGGFAIDPSLPLTNPDIKIAGPLLGYARTLDLLGASGKVDVIVPFDRLTGRARFRGVPLERRVEGMEDPVIRLSSTFYGAPAMTPTQFKSYKQDLLIGASLAVALPLGRYDPARVLNLSGHRWVFRPSLGVSKTFGRWVLEFKTDVTLFTENDDFFGGHRKGEAPIYAGQTHLIYNWPSGVWGSIDATYFTGGRPTIDGVAAGKSLQNGRVGASLTLPVTRRHSVKLYGSTGVSALTYANYSLVGVAWQYRWGAGF